MGLDAPALGRPCNAIVDCHLLAQDIIFSPMN